MGRHRQPEIAEQLLQRCTDHALEHGLPDRLDPLVRVTGTSARMLLYHFGTRDELLLAILRQARKRQLNSFGDLLRARPDEAYTTTLRSSLVRDDGSRRAAVPAHVQPAARGRGAVVMARIPAHSDHRLATATRRGRTQHRTTQSATLVLAVIRGLLIDVDATADTARTDRAFQELLDALDPA